VRIAILCSALLALSCNALAGQDDFRVLLIGNSHSSGNDLPDLVARLIQQEFPQAEVVVDRAARWAFLDERLDDNVTQKKLDSQPWTHVVLQAQKYSSSGLYDYPTDAAEEWIRRVRGRGAVPVLFPEWAREGNTEEGPRIYGLHMNIAAREPACVAPVGFAWQAVIDAHPDLKLHGADGNHSNRNGALLTAYVLYQTITGEPAVDLPDITKLKVDADIQQILRTAASKAHRLPNGCAAPTTSVTEPASQTAVLVTGASTGIGRNIAERLAAEGHFVYAGARKQQDLEALSAIENIQGVRLDVTVQADIDAAVETIRAGGKGLYGIVNNAGVVVMGILAETDESELDFVFDVNVYGPYRIVKALAPLIIESKGRISNISSMAGIASPPAYGVYSMSKHAVEAYSDSLAAEMGTVGVHVSVIEPGPYNSSAVSSSCARRQKQNDDPGDSLFTELASELAALCSGDSGPVFPEPDAVADAVMDALFSEEPERHYLAIHDQRQAEAIVRVLLQDLAEVNSNGHSFDYSRDELVRMLDEALR
jgi:NAD(P)-dependent dehydrogenase (short-subunit alcohol dehydrogenase family)